MRIFTARTNRESCCYPFTPLLLLTSFSFSWLYRLMLAHDANFRLKGRLRKTEVLDISLTNGLAYFVEDKAYKEYLASAGDGGGEVRPELLTVCSMG